MPKRLSAYAYSRATPKRGRFLKAKRVAPKRKSAGLYRKSGVRNGGVHRFTRYASANQNITLSAGNSGVGGAMTFMLSNVQNYTEFTNLFDQYKITKVEVLLKLHTNTFFQLATDGTTAINAPVAFPTIYMYNDHDDADTPTLVDMRQRQKVVRRVLRPNSVVKWSVRPSILNQLYRTALTTGYAPKFNQFIDCSATDVPHYGWKYYLDYDGYTTPSGGGYGQDIHVNVELKYHFECKDAR